MGNKIKKLNIPLYIISFVYSIVLLGVGAILGYYLNSQTYIKINDAVSSLESENAYLFAIDNTSLFCTFYKNEMPLLEQQSWNVGQKLELLEEKKRSNSLLKQRYMDFLVRDFMLSKKAKALCNKSFVEVLYFYTNKGDCYDCKKEGYELFKLREWAQKQNISIKFYAFDGTLEGSGKAMAEIYNITVFPSIVINNKKFNGFKSADELKPYLKKYE